MQAKIELKNPRGDNVTQKDPGTPVVRAFQANRRSRSNPAAQGRIVKHKGKLRIAEGIDGMTNVVWLKAPLGQEAIKPGLGFAIAGVGTAQFSLGNGRSRLKPVDFRITQRIFYAGFDASLTGIETNANRPMTALNPAAHKGLGKTLIVLQSLLNQLRQSLFDALYRFRITAQQLFPQLLLAVFASCEEVECRIPG
jgi:hypothetical protein